MSFKATINNHIGFADLVSVIKKLGDTCLLRLDINELELAVFTNGVISTASFFAIETDALFSRYRTEYPLNLVIPTREFRQMIYAVKKCDSTDIILKGEHNDYYLEFKSESTTRGGTVAEEIGELHVNVLSDREASDIRQPGRLPPDVCLTLRPLEEYYNYVHAFSNTINSILISATANGMFRLDYVGANVYTEHVSYGLKKPELDMEVPMPENMDQVFKVRVKSKHLSSIMSCEELDVKHVFVAITDEAQIMFFLFFSLGRDTRNSLTIHVPLYTD